MIVINKLKNNRKKFGPGLLIIATFLNPLGFTDLFKLIMINYNLSYDYTQFIFYLSSGFVYALYCFVMQINPLISISKIYRIYKIGYKKSLHYKKINYKK